MEENYTRELLERYVQKKTKVTELFKDLAYEEVFCSTYSREYDHDDLLPVFLTKEDAEEYYEKAGRKDPLIMKKTVFSIINANIGHDEHIRNAYQHLLYRSCDPSLRRRNCFRMLYRGKEERKEIRQCVRGHRPDQVG